MAKSKAKLPPLVITAMAAFQSLKPAEQRFKFAQLALSNRVTFLEMGKLHVLISANLTGQQTVYGELKKLGVRESSIDNAAVAAKVWHALVTPGHLSEAEFDTFTFDDCRAIRASMSEKSLQRLDPEACVAVIRSASENFAADLWSLADTGMTVAEVEAQAEAERKAAEAAAELERKRLEEQKQQQQAAANTTPVPPATTTVPTPQVVPTPAATPLANPTPTVTPPVQPTVPTNVTPLPPPTLSHEEICSSLESVLDEVMSESAELPPELQKRLFEKLNNCLGIVGERIPQEMAAAA